MRASREIQIPPRNRSSTRTTASAVGPESVANPPVQAEKEWIQGRKSETKYRAPAANARVENPRSSSPRPAQPATSRPRVSVVRQSLSPALCLGGSGPSMGANPKRLHPFGRFDADEIEAARDHRFRRAAEAGPERLLLALEHSVLVVE